MPRPLEGSVAPSVSLGEGERCKTVVSRLGRSHSEDDEPISSMPLDRTHPMAVDASCQTKVSKCGSGSKLMRPHNLLARLRWKATSANKQPDKSVEERSRCATDRNSPLGYGGEEKCLTIHVTAETKPSGRREAGLGEMETVECDKRKTVKHKRFGALSKISEDSLDRVGREGFARRTVRMIYYSHHI